MFYAYCSIPDWNFAVCGGYGKVRVILALKTAGLVGWSSIRWVYTRIESQAGRQCYSAVHRLGLLDEPTISGEARRLTSQTTAILCPIMDVDYVMNSFPPDHWLLWKQYNANIKHNGTYQTSFGGWLDPQPTILKDIWRSYTRQKPANKSAMRGILNFSPCVMLFFYVQSHLVFIVNQNTGIAQSDNFQLFAPYGNSIPVNVAQINNKSTISG